MVEDIWSRLAKHYDNNKGVSLADQFERNPRRFEEFTLRLDDMLLDYSKTSIDATARDLLLKLAKSARLEQKRDDMFRGVRINETEGRAALHTALRNIENEPVYVDGEDVMPDVAAMRERVSAFAEGIRSGGITTYDGVSFTDIVNIGIGGSDLGPSMATRALHHRFKNIHNN